jgi:hypothetical protein
MEPRPIRIFGRDLGVKRRFRRQHLDGQLDQGYLPSIGNYGVTSTVLEDTLTGGDREGTVGYRIDHTLLVLHQFGFATAR